MSELKAEKYFQLVEKNKTALSKLAEDVKNSNLLSNLSHSKEEYRNLFLKTKFSMLSNEKLLIQVQQKDQQLRRLKDQENFLQEKIAQAAMKQQLKAKRLLQNKQKSALDVQISQLESTMKKTSQELSALKQKH